MTDAFSKTFRLVKDLAAQQGSFVESGFRKQINRALAQPRFSEQQKMLLYEHASPTLQRDFDRMARREIKQSDVLAHAFRDPLVKCIDALSFAMADLNRSYSEPANPETLETDKKAMIYQKSCELLYAMEDITANFSLFLDSGEDSRIHDILESFRHDYGPRLKDLLPGLAKALKLSPEQSESLAAQARENIGNGKEHIRAIPKTRWQDATPPGA